MRLQTLGTLTGRPLLSLSSFLLAIVVGLTSSFTFTTAYDLIRASMAGERQVASGVWHGQWQGVHAVTIKIEQSGGALSGTARFARVVETTDGPRAVGESAELPLINPRLDGDRLSFEVRGADESQKVILARLEMRFTGEGEAELRREQEEESPAIPMLRERSF